MHDEVDERTHQAAENLENLPELMMQMFSQSQKTMEHHKGNFLSEVSEIIKKQ